MPAPYTTFAINSPATTNRPYKETATYDAFSHLNTRSSLHWSRTLGFGSSDTYVNNRRVGWSYDADGNWLSGAGRQHTYDAAGRTKTITWTYGGQFNQFFDGDGQRVKTVEGNSVTYYLRSTVLGGQVVEELSSAGVKEKGFVYAGQKLIAYQSQNGNVSLLHEDPSGVTQRASTPQSALVSYWAETDPWGAEVYNSDPYVQDPGFGGGRGEGGPVFPGFGDISMPSTGCTLDGVFVTCDMADRAFGMGAAVVGPRNPVKYNHTKKRFEFFRAFADGYSGYLPADAQYGTGGVGKRFLHFDYTGVTVPETGQSSGKWHAVFETIELNAQPQNPVQPPIDGPGVRQNIANRLTSNCKQYIANLINEAARQNRKNPAVSTDLLDIFDDVQRQGGFHRLQVGTRKNPSYSHVTGTIPGKNATVYLAPIKLYPDMTPAEITQGALGLDSLGAFHELTHLAGSKEYDDIQLSRAARALGGPALPTAKTNKNLDFSTYLENELKRNCPP